MTDVLMNAVWLVVRELMWFAMAVLAVWLLTDNDRQVGEAGE